jgi:hypothetical protein
MKSQSYMTRALRARDPRFATILGNLGYERGDLTAAEQQAAPETAAPLQPEKVKAKRKPRKDKASS